MPLILKQLYGILPANTILENVPDSVAKELIAEKKAAVIDPDKAKELAAEGIRDKAMNLNSAQKK